jgi:hypothetical protein
MVKKSSSGNTSGGTCSRFRRFGQERKKKRKQKTERVRGRKKGKMGDILFISDPIKDRSFLFSHFSPFPFFPSYTNDFASRDDPFCLFCPHCNITTFHLTGKLSAFRHGPLMQVVTQKTVPAIFWILTIVGPISDEGRGRTSRK